MQAITTTGDTIELVKDCDCVTHNGPHWLHMDDINRQLNRKLLDNGFLRGFIKNEIHRLNEKEHNMVQRGIVEIIRED